MKLRINSLQLGAALGGVLLAGCFGGGGPSFDGSNNPNPGGGGVDINPGGSVRGKAMYTMNISMSAKHYLIAKRTTNRFPNGTVFDDANHAVVLPSQTLTGTFLMVNKKLIGTTDASGNFRLIVKPAANATILIHRNISDPAIASLSGKQVLDAATTGSFSVNLGLNFDKLIAEMNNNLPKKPGNVHGNIGLPPGPCDDTGCDTDCGTATFNDCHVTKKTTCCLDYNGWVAPAGSVKDCGEIDDSSKIPYYFGSTCYQWVSKEVCGHGALRYVNPGNTDKGACIFWHKGRRCGEIDDSCFRVTPTTSAHGPAGKLTVGDTVTFVALNNTRNNETAISTDQATPDYGTLTSPTAGALDGSGTSFTLKHYEDPCQWFEERTVVFTAALPAGVNNATITFTFGPLNTQTFTYQICR